jgi:Putative polyhydroxyalkanoic acid system protein (PHA_gran_rgn)
MPKSIVVIVPHNIGAEAAKKRIAERIDALRSTYVDKLGYSEINWTGDRADLRLVVFGQTVTGQIDVMPDSLRIEAQLPWILDALANKIQGVLTSNAKESLQIGHTPPKAWPMRERSPGAAPPASALQLSRRRSSHQTT